GRRRRPPHAGIRDPDPGTHRPQPRGSQSPDPGRGCLAGRLPCPSGCHDRAFGRCRDGRMAGGGDPAACPLTSAGNRCKVDKLVRDPRSTSGPGWICLLSPVWAMEKGNRAMRTMLSLMVAVGVLAVGLALSGCTNRALSLMDTDPLYGNTHPHLVW